MGSRAYTRYIKKVLSYCKASWRIYLGKRSICYTYDTVLCVERAVKN